MIQHSTQRGAIERTRRERGETKWFDEQIQRRKGALFSLSLRPALCHRHIRGATRCRSWRCCNPKSLIKGEQQAILHGCAKEKRALETSEGVVRNPKGRQEEEQTARSDEIERERERERCEREREEGKRGRATAK